MNATRSKILIADDDPRMRQMIKDVLAGPGRVFLEAANGNEAVELHRKHRPDLVLMDIEMHPMDGITATRLIREHDATSRVVIVTQHDELGFRAAARQAGANAYLLKDELSELNERVLNLSDGGSGLPDASGPVS